MKRASGQPSETSIRSHWFEIDQGRMERYESMFRWNPATEHLYASADLRPGQVVGDFGCGPGHASIEFARRVGSFGHVHAFDINAEFVRRTLAKARDQGMGERVTAHLLDDAQLPCADATLDRIIVRNTLVYVDDPIETLCEFRRVLKPGGIAVAIEGDWQMTAVSPVPANEWHAVVEAASWVWAWPELGRNLYAYAREAGFCNVRVQVLTMPDTNGRLHGMIESVTDYAIESGRIAGEQVQAVLDRIDAGRRAGTYLAIAPQFVVTAIADGRQEHVGAR